MENPIITALQTRRSIRKYKPEQITDEELKTVLEAGTWAPTGMGYQDPWIIAIQDPALMERISRMNREIWGRDIDPFYGAPTYVLVFGSDPKKWANSVYDGALVLGNMMNAAHAVGLGACWIHREREMFETVEGQALMKRFGLPEGLIGVGAISLGYPADGFTPSQRKPRKAGYYRIVK